MLGNLPEESVLSQDALIVAVPHDSWKTSSRILPFTSLQAHSISTRKITKKLKTRLPPKTMLWYVQASPAFRLDTWQTIAHGRT